VLDRQVLGTDCEPAAAKLADLVRHQVSNAAAQDDGHRSRRQPRPQGAVGADGEGEQQRRKPEPDQGDRKQGQRPSETKPQPRPVERKSGHRESGRALPFMAEQQVHVL
jgi:hypothetical protein